MLWWLIVSHTHGSPAHRVISFLQGSLPPALSQTFFASFAEAIPTSLCGCFRFILWSTLSLNKHLLQREKLVSRANTICACRVRLLPCPQAVEISSASSLYLIPALMQPCPDRVHILQQRRRGTLITPSLDEHFFYFWFSLPIFLSLFLFYYYYFIIIIIAFHFH